MSCEFVKRVQTMIQFHPEVISWVQNGSEIAISDTQAFAKTILPKYFRHNRLESFVRQLNMYDFKKIVRKKNTINFWNKYFHRDNPHSHYLVRRRNAQWAAPNQNQGMPMGISNSLRMELQRNQGIITLFKKLLYYKNTTIQSFISIRSQLSKLNSDGEINSESRQLISQIKTQISKTICFGRNFDKRLQEAEHAAKQDNEAAFKDSQQESNVLVEGDCPNDHHLAFELLSDQHNEIFNQLFQI